MAIFYPSNQLEDPEFVAGLLGSFWSSLYGGRDQVVAFVDGRCQLEQQTFNDIQNLYSAGGRLTVPLFRRLRWFPVRIRESGTIPAEILPYGTTGLLYGAPGVLYGVSPFGSVAFAAPESLADVAVVCSHMTTPAVCLTKLIDFRVDRTAHRLVFVDDPFANPLFPVSDILDENLAVVDREIELWLFQADFDEEWMADLYGFVVGLGTPSSTGYKALVNELWDALVGGSARAQLDGVLSAMTGAERAIADGEVVEYVTSDSVGKLVITDKEVYRFHPDATILVSVGEILIKGQYLADTYIVYDINRGQMPPTWPALTLGRGFLFPGATDELTFQNATLPTTYIADDGFGFAELRFPIGGDPGDVDAFFDEMQARGRAINQTLAMSLDNRTNPVGQPGPTNVPAMLNPMELVIQQVLRYNALLVTIQGSQFGPDAFGLDLGTSVIRFVMPPWTTLLGLIRLTGVGESVTLALTGEGFANFDAMENQTDSASNTDVSDSLVAIFYV